MIKESGNIAEASDCVLSLFEPIRYNTTDRNYGDVAKFKDPETGNKYFRSISILKNSYGVDGVSVGTVFMGSTGQFRELPKSMDIGKMNSQQEERLLSSIFNGDYFLNN